MPERVWGFESPLSHVPDADYSTELAFAHELARLGGRIAMGHYRKNPASHKKEDGTWATEADWAVEAQIRVRIARTFPHHNILGEEEGLTAAGGGPANPDAPTWVVDPIDGTNNYMAGIPIWATLVALRVDGHNVVGVCNAPAIDEMYDAAAGLGARMNGESIQTQPVTSLEEATVLFASVQSFDECGLTSFFDSLVARSWRSRGFGDFWGHMLVARGAAHVMVEPNLNPWDVAALEPIVTEAGGRLTHLDGSPWSDGGSCLTTSGALHDEIHNLLQATTPTWREPG